MKISRICLGVATLAASLLASTANADLVIGLDFTENSATNVPVGTALGTTFDTVATSGSATYIQQVIDDDGTATQTGGNVILSDGVFTGEYSISLDAVTSDGSILQRNGSGTLGSAAGQFNDVSVTFSNLQLTFISGDDVFEFAGFSGLAVGNQGAATNETFDINNGFFTLASGDNWFRRR